MCSTDMAAERIGEGVLWTGRQSEAEFNRATTQTYWWTWYGQGMHCIRCFHEIILIMNMS